MYNDIKEILITEEQIQTRVKEMGKQIYDDYQNSNLLMVGVLKGVVPFFADLMRSIDMQINIDFMSVSSYGQNSSSTGEVRILKDLDYSVIDKDVLIIEDIIDSGYTLNYLKKLFLERGAKSVRTCAFLDKVDNREVDVEVEYIGYELPNEFIIGYGLDYAEKYRNLPFVASLKEEVYS
ncbi:hypoxanthine phosphoribosyltransferase [Helcococcus kunzii]|uniref:hypoxanthine phosphoribosyltransferase n=1 Tax=Helcococcus kunzii TaxID=40091 RepID=UPI0038B0535C